MRLFLLRTCFCLPILSKVALLNPPLAAAYRISLYFFLVFFKSVLMVMRAGEEQRGGVVSFCLLFWFISLKGSGKLCYLIIPSPFAISCNIQKLHLQNLKCTGSSHLARLSFFLQVSIETSSGLPFLNEVCFYEFV